MASQHDSHDSTSSSQPAQAIDSDACRQLEEALRASDARFRTQFESTPVPTFLWQVAGGQFTLVDANAAAERLTLGKAHTFLGMTAEQLYANQPDLLERFQMCLAQQAVIVYETPYCARGTGLDRIIVFTFAYVAPDLILLHANDLTEYRQAENAHRTGHANMIALLENTDGSIWSVDREYRLIAGNSVFRQDILATFGRAFAVGDCVLAHANAGALNDVWRAYYDRALRGERFSVETQRGLVQPPNWYEYRLSPIYDSEGNVTGVTVFGRDITARIQAEAAARASDAQYRTLVEQASDGIFLANPEGRYIEVNTAGCKLLGYTREELLQKTTRDVTDLSPEKPLRLDELRSGKALLTERTMIRKDGSRVPVEISAKQLDDGRFQGIVRDITERKRAEDERAQLQAQLLQAQKMETVGRLAGGIAHDFNNLLAVIMMRTELALRMTEPSTPLHHSLTAVYTTAQRSADLVRQLLGFARKQTIAPKVLDLNAAVAGALPMLNKLIGEEIELAWHPGAQLWPIKLDPSQLDQILANLCVNARDAIDGVGKIMIETENVALDEIAAATGLTVPPGDYVALVVTDNGSGMDPEILAHIFEPFFTTKTVGKGTGLGLATVDGIVQQNGGQITVYSRPGHGASFRVYLPRFGEDEIAPAANQPHDLPQGHGETVLLVEDEATVLQMGQEALELLGYKVMAATGPGAALGLAAHHAGRIDLLITDIVMPEMNGRELAERIAALQPDIQRLYISGYPADFVAHRGVLEAGVHFLQKPFALQSLAAKVTEALA
jgi:PAS domain S-box-containing protein